MQKICQNCQQSNVSEAMFCRQCASPLGNFQAKQPNYSNQAQNNQQMNFAPAKQGASGRAMGAAGLAVLGLFCCGLVAGLPAAILGWLEISAIKEGKSSPEGMMMAQIGLWLGIIGSIVTTLLGFFMMILSSAGGGY
jgi:hypothetical protein